MQMVAIRFYAFSKLTKNSHSQTRNCTIDYKSRCARVLLNAESVNKLEYMRGFDELKREVNHKSETVYPYNFYYSTPFLLIICSNNMILMF